MAELKKVNVSCKIDATLAEELKKQADERKLPLSAVLNERLKAIPEPVQYETSEYIIDLRKLEPVNFAAMLELLDTLTKANDMYDVLTQILDAIRIKGGQVKQQYIEQANEILK